MSNSKFNCAVLVLGDLNRSPRMLNHCVALSNAFPDINEISLIGFNGGDLREDISSNPKIKVHYIPTSLNNKLKKLPRSLFILSAFLRIIIQLFSLFYILLTIPKPKFLILQNPPGIPSMFICYIASFIKRFKFIIDWHNYGYTILEVNKRNKLICKIAYVYEKLFSKTSNMNFCVSKAMQRDLKERFGISAIWLPDRPVKGLFKFINETEANDMYAKYKNELGDLIVQDKQDKPITMISSTSWTPDEDFNMLLNCFINVEKTLNNKEGLKKVLFLITGRGPMKEEFMLKVKEAKLRIFDVKSILLDSDDYPKLLSLVDLGVSLHYSSSGIDLPMKVVDMFSACLPAAAIYFPTIGELVKEEENGFLFKNEEDLGKLLVNVIEEFSFKGHHEKIDVYRKNLKKALNENDWTTQWLNNVKPEIIKFI